MKGTSLLGMQRALDLPDFESLVVHLRQLSADRTEVYCDDNDKCEGCECTVGARYGPQQCKHGCTTVLDGWEYGRL